MIEGTFPRPDNPDEPQNNGEKAAAEARWSFVTEAIRQAAKTAQQEKSEAGAPDKTQAKPEDKSTSPEKKPAKPKDNSTAPDDKPPPAGKLARPLFSLDLLGPKPDAKEPAKGTEVGKPVNPKDGVPGLELLQFFKAPDPEKIRQRQESVRVAARELRNLKDLSIDEKNFELFGPEVSKMLTDNGVQRISLLKVDGTTKLVVELKKPLEKELDPASGCRKITIAGKLIADLKISYDGNIDLSNIKGLSAEVDPGNDPLLGIPLPWITATAQRFTIRNAAENPEAEVVGSWNGISKSQSIALPDEYIDMALSIVGRTTERAKQGDDRLAPKAPKDELLKPPPPDSSWQTLAAELLVASVIISKLVQRYAEARKMAAIKSMAAQSATYFGDHPLEGGKEIGLGRDGAPIAKGDATKPSVVIRHNKDGSSSIEVTADGGHAYIKDASGKVRAVTPKDGVVQLQQGDSVAVGTTEFRSVSERPVSPFRLRMVDPHEEPIQGELVVELKPNQEYQIGRGKSLKPILAEGKPTLIQFDSKYLSRAHVQVGVDAKGMYIIDGGPEKGSTFGTFVNGQPMEAGAKYYLAPTDKVTLNNPQIASPVEIKIERTPSGPAVHVAEPRPVADTVRVLKHGEKATEIGPNRDIIIGKVGHLDLRGKSQADMHALLRTDAHGNAFIRCLTQPEGAPPAKAYIERADGTNQPITVSDGWVPIGKADKVSVGGSPLMSLEEQLRPSTEVKIGGEVIDIAPGEFVELGRPDGREFRPDGTRRIDLKDAGRTSRTHANLGVDAQGRLYIEDIGTKGEGSAYGTWVNGEQIPPKTRRYLNPTDTVVLGDGKKGSVTLDLHERTYLGSPVVAGEPRRGQSPMITRQLGDEINPKPPAQPAEPKPDKPANKPADKPAEKPDAGPKPRDLKPVVASDPVLPREMRGSYVVGTDNGQRVRIMGGLGEKMPHESIRLSTSEGALLGTAESGYTTIELYVRGREVTYYRPKDNPHRFYILSEESDGSPKLVRDYEVFVEPKSEGGNGRDGRNDRDKPPPPEDRKEPGKDEPPKADKPPGEKPPTTPPEVRPRTETPRDMAIERVSAELPSDFTAQDVENKVDELISRERARGQSGDGKLLEALVDMKKQLQNDPLAKQQLSDAVTSRQKAAASSTPGKAVVSTEPLKPIGAETGTIRDGVATPVTVGDTALPPEATREIDKERDRLAERKAELEKKQKTSPEDAKVRDELVEVNRKLASLEMAKGDPVARGKVAEWVRKNGAGLGKGIGVAALFVFIYAVCTPSGQASDKIEHAPLKKTPSP